MNAKQYRILTYLLITFASLVFISACSSDDDDPVSVDEETDFSLILASFADNTVVATYADMKLNAGLLKAAVEEFSSNPTQEKLNEACNLWKTTREPWEKGEAFLFGPAAFLSLDPSLDSWPLDQAQLQEVLESSFEL